MANKKVSESASLTLNHWHASFDIFFCKYMADCNAYNAAAVRHEALVHVDRPTTPSSRTSH